MRWLCRLGACILVVSTTLEASDAIVLSGRVVDEDEAPVGGASITVRFPPPRASLAAQVTSDPTGAFSLNLPEAGLYRFTVSRAGFFELRDREVDASAAREVTLVLSPAREVFQSLDVNGRPSQVSVDRTERDQRLSATNITDIPYPSSHSLRNAMRLMPQVIQDPTGSLHFAGSAENQMLYTLNGFDIGDPITNRLRTRLAVEAARSIEFSTGRYSPEYGKGSAGALAIQTETGADQLRYNATNFIPGLDTHQGVHLGGWTPRFGLSGPISKGRAWFADNCDIEFDNHFVNGLPQGQNQQTGWAASNLLHSQVNLTPANLLFADFLVNFDHQNHAALGALDPISTTTTQSAREYFWSLKDQVYLGHGTLIELGVAQNRFDLGQTPQGAAPYVISPAGRSGNFFVNSSQYARRDQFVGDVFLPRFHALGTHQLKAGTGLDRLNYRADFQRTSYERLGLAGELLSRTYFTGSGRFERPNLELSSYILDNWRLYERLNLEAGVRQDWDELVRRVSISPRIAFSWAPFASGLTRLSGGYAITYDASNLALFSQPLDQTAVVYTYNPDGTLAGPPGTTSYVVPYGHLQAPRYTNWSATLSRRLPRHLDVALDYLRRTGSNGFTYLPGSVAGASVLTNLRRDQYDAVQVTMHQSLHAQYEWSATYTRSRALSNAVLDLSVDQVYRVLNNFGPMPWDAPHRFLGWMYLPLPRKNWAVAVLADGRTGFPFSAQDEAGRIAGEVNSHRYPFNFDLNLYVERTLTLRGYRFAIRGGFNNLTDARNPTAVNNTLGSPNYLQFYGTEGRHFQARIRFFGRT